MHLNIDTVLQGGKYRIIRFISSGGFGCTYEAEHVMLEKRVAIKEFFVKDFCNRDETTAHITVGTISKKGLVEKLRRKFIDEAKALCRLHHPGIVSVSDVFEENGTAYFVMDYIDGPSLSDIVHQNGPLPEDRAVRYICQVATALQYVHDNNRLHLDIKPGNIMIDSNDTTILIDFGASKQYDEEDGENTSTLMGKTPGYAPPEQMSNSVVKFLPATDIYALGATLYKLLTGITPMDANLRNSGEELEPLPANTSAATRNAVAAAMQINKNKRPQSLAVFLRLLQGSPTASEEDEATELNETASATAEVIDQQPSKLAPEPKPKPKPKPVPKPNSTPNYKWIWYVASAIIIIGTIAIIVIGAIAIIIDTDSPSTPLAVVENTSDTENVEYGAPLSEGEVVDGRGGFDDNANGYFNMHADTYLTSNRDVYFDGYFSDTKGEYPISLKFEIDDDWFPGICYYHNIDYNTKLKMSVRFTEEQMIITGDAGESKFVMHFTPTIDGKWEGEAQNGNHRLRAKISPVKMP